VKSPGYVDRLIVCVHLNPVVAGLEVTGETLLYAQGGELYGVSLAGGDEPIPVARHECSIGTCRPPTAT